jgi:hypothetical protein
MYIETSAFLSVFTLLSRRTDRNPGLRSGPTRQQKHGRSAEVLACEWKCGCLPRTRRRSVHASRNLSRAPSASLRDRLRRPWTEPACRTVRQQSGSGERSGQDKTRHDSPEPIVDAEDQDAEHDGGRAQQADHRADGPSWQIATEPKHPTSH